jgi:hypothetical protein
LKFGYQNTEIQTEGGLPALSSSNRNETEVASTF